MPAPPAPQQPTPDKQETYLSPDERNELRRMLKDPADYPKELGSWVTEFIAVQGIEVPVSQIRGFTQFARTASVATVESITQSDYGDLSTVGPTIDGVADGRFLCMFGAWLSQGTPVDKEGCMAPAVNGETLGTTDTHAARGWNTSNIARVVALDLSNGGNNIVRMKYRTPTAGTPSVTFQNRWMVLCFGTGTDARFTSSSSVG